MKNSILFHCNSGCTDAPKCYVLRSLPVWFIIQIFWDIHIGYGSTYCADTILAMTALTVLTQYWLWQHLLYLHNIGYDGTYCTYTILAMTALTVLTQYWLWRHLLYWHNIGYDSTYCADTILAMTALTVLTQYWLWQHLLCCRSRSADSCTHSTFDALRHYQHMTLTVTPTYKNNRTLMAKRKHKRFVRVHTITHKLWSTDYQHVTLRYGLIEVDFKYLNNFRSYIQPIHKISIIIWSLYWYIYIYIYIYMYIWLNCTLRAAD
jgi:hypothetical protein